MVGEKRVASALLPRRMRVLASLQTVSPLDKPLLLPLHLPRVNSHTPNQ